MATSGGQPSSPGPLSCQRERFSLPEGLHYLNCAYMSPLAGSVERAGIRGLRRRRAPTDIDEEDFFDACDVARRRFARLVGADDPGRVALIPAVSYGVAVCARNVEVRPGQNVVVAREQFPSNVYGWRRLCRERELELRTVGPDGPGDPAPDSARDGGSRARRWNRRLRESVDDHTAVVALAPVQWTDGTLFDLSALSRRAREVGAAVVVDGTQAVGALPFDVNEIRPDALICAGYKWLLGPFSLGLAWFGPRFDGGVPLEETWLGREGSEDFAGLTDYVEEYQPGAARYDMGERGSLVSVPMLAEALRLVLEWRPERIQRYCEDLTAELVREAPELGFRIEADSRRAAHLFGVRLPADLGPEALRSRLARRDVAVSVRGSALRVAPHVYNNAEDIDALREVLREVAG